MTKQEIKQLATKHKFNAYYNGKDKTWYFSNTELLVNKVFFEKDEVKAIEDKFKEFINELLLNRVQLTYKFTNTLKNIEV